MKLFVDINEKDIDIPSKKKAQNPELRDSNVEVDIARGDIDLQRQLEADIQERREKEPRRFPPPFKPKEVTELTLTLTIGQANELVKDILGGRVTIAL